MSKIITCTTFQWKGKSHSLGQNAKSDCGTPPVMMSESGGWAFLYPWELSCCIIAFHFMERYWSCNQTDKIICRKSQFYQFTVILLSFVSLYSHTWLEPFFWIPGNFVWVFTLGEEVVIMNMYILYVVLQWIPLRHLFWPRLRGNRTPVNMVFDAVQPFFQHLAVLHFWKFVKFLR